MTASRSKSPRPQPKRYPRPYLSWSQLSLFQKSPREFAQRYIYGENRTNPAMELGKTVATMLEKDIEQDDAVLEHARIFLPSYPSREHRIEATIAGVPIMGLLDGYDPATHHIGEYKTGRLWTQALADQTKQLHFYALLIHLAYRVPPDKIGITLHWLPTDWNGGDPKITGEIVNFETRRTQMDLLNIGKEIVDTWRAIGEFCEKEYRSIGL